LRLRNVNLISLTENIDLQSISGRLISQVLAAVAEYETELRRERIVNGMSVAKKNGKSWGGRKANSRNKEVATKVEAILKLHQAGEPVMRIANMLKVSRPTVYSILRRGQI
jgi:DNA invertase Pin-like site-specific DNA recombinase